MNPTGETNHTLLIRPEETGAVIDSFLSMRVSVFRNFPEPSGSDHPFHFSDLCNTIRKYAQLKEEELDKLTILDFLRLADKTFTAGYYDYRNIANPDLSDLVHIDRFRVFCRTFMEALLYQRHNKAPQALPVRLFLELPVWSLDSYALEVPEWNEQNYPVLMHSINSVARRFGEVNDLTVLREQTVFKLLNNLNIELHMPWLPHVESIETYQNNILSSYSGIYTLLIQPFKEKANEEVDNNDDE